MTPIRTLIVDDEPLARENLRLRLEGMPDFLIVGESESGREAVRAVEIMRPELMFLDIRMPDLDGFEVIERIPPSLMPIIVFVTAYDRFALDAFRVHALDYLLKPIEDERFEEAVRLSRERVLDLRGHPKDGEAPGRLDAVMPQDILRPRGPARKPPGDAFGSDAGDAVPPPGSPPSSRPDRAAPSCWHRLVIKTRGRVLFLGTDRIDWIESNGDYCSIHAGEQTYLLRVKMHELESRLDPGCFVRVSRFAIVSLSRIDQLTPLPRGEFLVHLPRGRKVKITRSHRRELEKRMGHSL